MNWEQLLISYSPPRGLGNTSALGASSLRRRFISSSTASMGGVIGTGLTWSFKCPVFRFSGGTFQIRRSRSNSFYVANRTSERRTAVNTTNSSRRAIVV